MFRLEAPRFQSCAYRSAQTIRMPPTEVRKRRLRASWDYLPDKIVHPGRRRCLWPLGYFFLGAGGVTVGARGFGALLVGGVAVLGAPAGAPTDGNASS